MDNKIIIHVSEIDINTNGGMGRVEYYWKTSFEKKGFQFIHIGPNEVGPTHKWLFPYKAYDYFKKLNIKPAAFIVHEPVSGQFVNKGIPCFLESHGVERRAWEIFDIKKSIKTKIIFPLWRLRNCDLGLKKANKLLLINSDDSIYVKKKYKRKEDDIFLFKNGVDFHDKTLTTRLNDNFTILFNGSWIERKGIAILIEAADILYKKYNVDFHYLLIGTGKDVSEVQENWPEYLKKNIKVIPKFEATDEIKYLEKASLFVLPSFFEGQPLSLLQAMSVGICCITTNSCGQKDIITDDYDGILISAGNSLELSESIYKCYNDSETLMRIGNNAKEHMKSRGWEIVSDEVTDFIIKNI